MWMAGVLRYRYIVRKHVAIHLYSDCTKLINKREIYMKALYNDGSVAEVADEDVVHVIRHSAAHIMAQAIKRLYPEADFAYGPEPITASITTSTSVTRRSARTICPRSRPR